jgi:plasmid stability protein
MSSLIQIRNVPEGVVDKLKARAALQGRSLNSLMLEIVEREAEEPSKGEILARIRARGPLGTVIKGGEAAEIIREAREEREERDRQLMEARLRRR